MTTPLGPRVEPVDWLDPRAEALRAAMDAETRAMYEQFIASRSPEEQAAVDDALTVDAAAILDTVILLHGEEPVGHAALRPALGVPGALEVKKVFVPPAVRGHGLARRLMAHLEELALARGASSLVLQTGPLQKPAIALYESIGYRPIPPFGKYDAVPGALCFGKELAG